MIENMETMMMTGIEIEFASDNELFDRLDFIENLTNIKGYEIDFSDFKNEWNLICDELDFRTSPDKSENGD